MPSRRPLLPLPCLGAICALAGCTPPPPVLVPTAPRHAAAPADWFHRQLALARHARATHVPAADRVGAQRAYFAVMVPVCGKVAAAGPDKYRARCRALISQATTDSVNANAAPASTLAACDEDRDDSEMTQAQITACSD